MDGSASFSLKVEGDMLIASARAGHMSTRAEGDNESDSPEPMPNRSLFKLGAALYDDKGGTARQVMLSWA